MTRPQSSIICNYLLLFFSYFFMACCCCCCCLFFCFSSVIRRHLEFHISAFVFIFVFFFAIFQIYCQCNWHWHSLSNYWIHGGYVQLFVAARHDGDGGISEEKQTLNNVTFRNTTISVDNLRKLCNTRCRIELLIKT